jgi:hypothetical protein
MGYDITARDGAQRYAGGALQRAVIEARETVGEQQRGQFIMTMTYDGGTYYARYAVDESGPRAKLRSEWRRSSHPDSISANAAIYIDLKNVYL